MFMLLVRQHLKQQMRAKTHPNTPPWPTHHSYLFSLFIHQSSILTLIQHHKQSQGASSGAGYPHFLREMLRAIRQVVQYVSTTQDCSNYPIIKKQNMREHSYSPTSKRKYSNISLQKRLNLVRLVTQEGQAVTKAAKKLCIKLCTARIILKKYKQTGRFPMKSTRSPPPASSIPQSAQQATPPFPDVAQPQGEVLRSDGSFTGSQEWPKEEGFFYPFWMQWQQYYAMMASQTMLYSF